MHVFQKQSPSYYHKNYNFVISDIRALDKVFYIKQNYHKNMFTHTTVHVQFDNNQCCSFPD